MGGTSTCLVCTIHSFSVLAFNLIGIRVSVNTAQEVVTNLMKAVVG